MTNEKEFPSFNSKLVRLKEKRQDRKRSRLLRSFNSKLVRLKAPQVASRVLKLARFNSKLVRLKGITTRQVTPNRVKVSIPNWFD